jgi:ubiquinone biosynthesis protein UbiJ
MMQLWQELSLAKTQSLLNQALSQDLMWETHAQALEGQRVLFQLQTVDYFVLAQCQQHYVSLSFETAQTPADLTVTATPKACMQALRDKALPRSIKIAGDAILAQHLQAALFNSHIDWEGFLSLHVGDIPARALHQGLKKASDFFSRLKTDFFADTHDYVLDEAKLIVPTEALNNFTDDVTALRYAVDRLEARINTLTPRILHAE